jgi:O-acetyl-ADP-ribose deacetylase (regulator of RNase III)
MPFKIIRNDITKMHCDAIVNTANSKPIVGPGCDYAVYTAAGYDELLKYRRENIGEVPEGKVFLTPAFDLESRYIIHAVSPLYLDGNSGEEKKLRACYRKSLALAYDNRMESIAFPLISTGGFGYPIEEGMRIAIDEINMFLMRHKMLIYLVVFDVEATELGGNLYSDLEAYIDRKYVEKKLEEEYDCAMPTVAMRRPEPRFLRTSEPEPEDFDFLEKHEGKLSERMEHMSDTFSEYLLYLIKSRGLTNAEVYKKAIVDKKVFSKIKNNPKYHPQKMTAMCLCVGAQLNLDETKDLLARAGYALSPCDKTDVIFSYFIENEIYDMIELDIQLEEHGEKCLIS